MITKPTLVILMKKEISFPNCLSFIESCTFLLLIMLLYIYFKDV